MVPETPGTVQGVSLGMHQVDKEATRTHQAHRAYRSGNARVTPQVSAHFLDVWRSINGPLAAS